MANYYGVARTNYFHVKDEAKFREWADTVCCRVIEHKADEDGKMFGLISECEGGWSCSRDNEETGEDEDFDITEEIQEHLDKDDVAVFQEVGNEKMRYFCGQAVAVNADGDVDVVDLNDVFMTQVVCGNYRTRVEY